MLYIKSKLMYDNLKKCNSLSNANKIFVFIFIYVRKLCNIVLCLSL